MRFGSLFLSRAWLLPFLLCLGTAHAEATRPGEAETGQAESWAFKLTPSYYATTHQADAADVNLRANHGAHAVWLGYYRRGSEFEQTRTGYEYSLDLPFGKLVPSAQLATHGFVGGSVNAEIGDQVYGLLGFGRTNLKDYYNLTFDPNDSVVYGMGTRLIPQSNLSLFAVQDNRLHTGQRVTHLVWRRWPDDRQRWTIDLSAKHGRPAVDEALVSGLGLSVTYDYRGVFVRVAREAKVNFSPDDMTRISLGMRF